MKIAFISDTHLADVATDFVRNAALACAWADGSGADLVVHLGDITADGVIDAAHYQSAETMLATLRTPLRLVPGNHDIGDAPRADGASHEPPVSAETLAVYRRIFGADYWRMDAAGWTLLALNAQLFGLGDEAEAAQFAWIRETLADVWGPIGLLLHKPLFRTRPDDEDAHHRYVPPAARQRLLDLFRGGDLRFVVSGHTHQSRRLIWEGVEHIWAPSTAFIIPDRLQERIGEKAVGVMLLTLERDRHGFETIMPPGLKAFDLGDYANVYPRLAHHD